MYATHIRYTCKGAPIPITWHITWGYKKEKITDEHGTVAGVTEYSKEYELVAGIHDV